MAAFKLTFPKYHSKDAQILVATMLPMAILMSSFLYGKRYWTDPGILITTTLIGFLVLGASFIAYGIVAISLRSRFPHEFQLNIRLSLAITLFLIMSAVIISLLLRGYEYINLYDYHFSESDFLKVFTAFATMNIFLTFLNEGVSVFEKYKTTTRETEELKKIYFHSQLLSLKSQVNPHFLFNSLNTLSSLINEDPEKAESFLDEMSKVYRYILKTKEDQLVSLDTELSFLKSYFSLLHSRLGSAISLNLDIDKTDHNFLLPPLTFQLLLDNIINNNCISKSDPLFISIKINNDWLEISNNIQPRIGNCTEIDWTSIQNLSDKFKLLCQEKVEVLQSEFNILFRIPLINQKSVTTHD